jgi:hypothetical protein
MFGCSLGDAGAPIETFEILGARVNGFEMCSSGECHLFCQRFELHELESCAPSMGLRVAFSGIAV